MKHRFLAALGCAGLLASLSVAQNLQRRANITGGGDRNRGKCTIEVIVDGVADIEIRGDSAYLRNQSGQRPQWRRFECTAPIPDNPANFHFIGVDGRGRQQMIQVPQGGGAVVVRIEDREGGAEGYTFDLTWDLRSGEYTEGPGYADNRRFPVNQAAQACQQAVRQQAANRFGGANVTFRTAAIDDQPGRNDWVVGTMDVYDRGSAQSYRYSCLVDFNNGQIRNVEIEAGQGPPDYRDQGDRHQFRSPEEQACERAVVDRLRRDRYSNIDIGAFQGDRQGRANRIAGSVRANRDGRVYLFNFSCSIDRNNMRVRSISLKRQ